MFHYKTSGTCSSAIDFEVKDNIVTQVKFTNGCRGNTAGVASLCIGMTPQQIIDRCKGIQCRGGTSCPDQLARALQAYLDGQKQAKRLNELPLME